MAPWEKVGHRWEAGTLSFPGKVKGQTETERYQLGGLHEIVIHVEFSSEEVLPWFLMGSVLFLTGELSLEGDLQLWLDYPRTPIDVFPFEVQDPPHTPMTVLLVLTEVGQKTGIEAVECVLWSAESDLEPSPDSWLASPFCCASGFLNLRSNLSEPAQEAQLDSHWVMSALKPKVKPSPQPYCIKGCLPCVCQVWL